MAQGIDAVAVREGHGLKKGCECQLPRARLKKKVTGLHALAAANAEKNLQAQMSLRGQTGGRSSLQK